MFSSQREKRAEPDIIALVELDRKKVRVRIVLARDAIRERLRELEHPRDYHGEEQGIEDVPDNCGLEKMMQTIPRTERRGIKAEVARSAVVPNCGKKSVLRRILGSVLTGILLSGASLAQDSAQAQADESVSQSNSVSTEKLAAQVKSDTPATASHLTNVSDRRDRAQTTVATQLEAGTTIHTSLIKPVGARKNKPGDEVIAKTTENVKSQDGVVVMRVGSTIIGHVTEVAVLSRGQESAVEIVLDHALLTDATKVSMALDIQAIGRGQAHDLGEVEDEWAIDGQVRATMAMRALATPASMGGSMLRHAITLMNAAADPAQAGGVTEPLISNSQGVVGLPDLYLSAQVSGSTHASVVSSKNTNVRLSQGTEMILRVIIR